MADRDPMAKVIEQRLRISLPTRDDLGHIADEIAKALRQADEAVPVPIRDPEKLPYCPLRHLTERFTPLGGPTVKTQLSMADQHCLGDRCAWWDDEGTCAIVAQVRRGRRP